MTAQSVHEQALNLDVWLPGWWENVDPRTLNLHFDETCVLGQAGVNIKQVIRGEHPWITFKQFRVSYCCHDLNCNLQPFSHDENLVAWKKEIQERVFGTYEINMGNIGDPKREIELEPLEEPEPVKVEPGAPATPAPAPAEPVKEPEKVPA